MLHPPSPRRERILLFGPSGSGKSTAWTTIASWITRTRSTARVYVGDTDNAWDAMRPLDGSLDLVCDVFPWHDWTEIRDGVRKLRELGPTTDDWLIVDMIDKVWARAQEGYFEQVFGRDLDEFFAMMRPEDRTKTIAGDYGTNWQAINKMYATVADLVMSRWPGHVLCCAPAQRVWEANRSDEVSMAVFNKLEQKPAGQKDLPHLFHTVLLLQQAPSGWKITTAKERNPPGSQEGDPGHRGYLEGEELRDFVRDYLMRIGGWRP